MAPLSSNQAAAEAVAGVKMAPFWKIQAAATADAAILMNGLLQLPRCSRRRCLSYNGTIMKMLSVVYSTQNNNKLKVMRQASRARSAPNNMSA